MLNKQTIKDMEELTLELLNEKFYGNVYEGIKFAETFKKAEPKKPLKPILGHDHTSYEALIYAKGLEVYEKELFAYQEESKKRALQANTINSIIEEFIKSEASFYDYVPKDKQSKVWEKAYEDGHSSGFYEVYLELESLVGLFI